MSASGGILQLVGWLACWVECRPGWCVWERGACVCVCVSPLSAPIPHGVHAVQTLADLSRPHPVVVVLSLAQLFVVVAVGNCCSEAWEPLGVFVCRILTHRVCAQDMNASCACVCVFSPILDGGRLSDKSVANLLWLRTSTDLLTCCVYALRA